MSSAGKDTTTASTSSRRSGDSTLKLCGRRPRADCVRAVLVRESSHGIVVAHDIRSSCTIRPWTDLGNDNCAARFDRRVQSRSVHWRACEKNARAGKRRTPGDLICRGAGQGRIDFRIDAPKCAKQGKDFSPSDARDTATKRQQSPACRSRRIRPCNLVPHIVEA